jgi:hypothetical protein
MDTHAAASCAPKLLGSGLTPAHMAHTRAAKHAALNACMTRPVRMHAKGSVCFAQECMRALLRRRQNCAAGGASAVTRAVDCVNRKTLGA